VLRLRRESAVRSLLTDSGQQRRRILCNSVSAREDLFFLAGKQDKQKGPPA
jgi:hypothetical protein